MVDLETKKGPVLLVPVGLPGSGKTNWAQGLFWEVPGIEIVSADKIRRDLFGSFNNAHTSNGDGNISDKHKKVFDIFYDEIRANLISGKKVIADASNIKTFARTKLIEIGRECNAEVRAVVFKNGANLDLCQGPPPPDKTFETMVEHFEKTVTLIEKEDFDKIAWV